MRHRHPWRARPYQRPLRVAIKIRSPLLTFDPVGVYGRIGAAPLPDSGRLGLGCAFAERRYGEEQHRRRVPVFERRRFPIRDPVNEVGSDRRYACSPGFAERRQANAKCGRSLVTCVPRFALLIVDGRNARSRFSFVSCFACISFFELYFRRFGGEPRCCSGDNNHPDDSRCRTESDCADGDFDLWSGAAESVERSG
jgi:hypothetical protein